MNHFCHLGQTETKHNKCYIHVTPVCSMACLATLKNVPSFYIFITYLYNILNLLTQLLT